MTSSFEEKAVLHRRIMRGDETYGDGARGVQAARFYLDEMLESAVTAAHERSDVRPRAPVDLLISLAGFSPITTVIAYRLLLPRRVLVISSENAGASIDVIGDYLVGVRGLRHKDFKHDSGDPTDPLAVYRAVKRELETLARTETTQPYAVIDITGGRKVMSAAAALAAWQLQLDLCYIECEYDPESGQPVLGSDRLLLLDNPTSLFGEQEMSAASQLFSNGAFGVARERYGELCETIAMPGPARFMRALSDLYEAWCDLDLARLGQCVDAVDRAIVNERHFVDSDDAARIDAQLAFLRRLVAEDRDSLIVCFYILGEHYAGLGRRDFAALLFYRTIEGCLTRRLEARGGRFECAKPNYALLTSDPLQLLERYSEAFSATGMGARASALPRVVGLMDAAILLMALDDPLARDGGVGSKRGLSSLRTLTTERNRSVLAHGYRTVDPEQCGVLRKRAFALLRVYWRLQGHEEDVSEMCRDLRFVRLDR